MISIQLKYGPWRDALLDAWRQRGKPAAECIEVKALMDKGLHERASRLHSMLMLTMGLMAKRKVSEAWSSNCFRTVGRHSSPEMVLHHLGLLVKDSSGEDGTWLPAKSPHQVEVSTQKLMKVIWAWTIVRKEICKAPRSCHEWLSFQRSAFKELKKKIKVDIPRLPMRGEHACVRMWTLRTLMLMLMAQEGVQKLVVDNKITAWKFCSMCPDQNGHVRKLHYHSRPSIVQDFLEKCGFGDGPPELFSCVTCFAGGMAWDGLAHSKYNVDLWNQALDTYACKHGMVAIPAVIIKEL